MMEQESEGAANKIMHSSEVKGALKEIVQILVEEDKKHIDDIGEGEWFEFFLMTTHWIWISLNLKTLHSIWG